MLASTLSFAWPLALDGESITGDGTAIAVLSIVSIVGGYLVLFALWHFVFRDRSPKRTEQRPTANPRPETPNKRPSVTRRRGSEPPPSR